MASREVIEIEFDVSENNFGKAIEHANSMIGQITLSNVLAQVGNLSNKAIALDAPNIQLTALGRLENKRG